jgi:hypothetical protein
MVTPVMIYLSTRRLVAETVYVSFRERFIDYLPQMSLKERRIPKLKKLLIVFFCSTTRREGSRNSKSS